jgi:hypothetical protein
MDKKRQAEQLNEEKRKERSIKEAANIMIYVK